MAILILTKKRKLCGDRKAKPIFNVMNYIRRNQIV